MRVSALDQNDQRQLEGRTLDLVFTDLASGKTPSDQVIQAHGILTGAAVLAEPMPARRIRTRPRVVKRAISKYRAKERSIDRRTYPATLATKILTPDPGP